MTHPIKSYDDAVAFHGHACSGLALGYRAAQYAMDALRAGRSGLRRNDFGPLKDGAPLPTWIGRVDGLEEAALPDTLAGWECRNNRLAWLALHQDGLRDAVQALRDRYGADRVAIVVGTSKWQRW